MGTDTKTMTDKDPQGPTFRDWAVHLLELSERIFASEKLRIAGEAFQFMVLCFASKMTEHMRSLLSLDGHRDMAIIARVMLDGMIQLKWTAEESQELRAEMWRKHYLVHDWKLYDRQLKEGAAPDPDHETMLLEKLEKHKDWYLTKVGIERLAEGKKLSKRSFHRSWHKGMSKANMFDKFEMTGLYDRYFVPFSGWVHWSSAELSWSLEKVPEGVRFNPMTELDSTGAIIAGIEGLLVVLKLAEIHLEIGFADELSRFQAGYEYWHRTYIKGEDPSTQN